jgi:nucleotide-binding universal stress UspA family protein
MASTGIRPPILAAFSADTGARDAVEFGLAASRVTGAPLIVVYVTHANVATDHALRSSADAPHGAHHHALQHLERDLEQRGIRDVVIRTFNDRGVARGLAQAMDKLEPELIVLGSSDRGTLGSVFLGTTTESVIHDSACPVAIAPYGYARPEHGVQLIGAAYARTAEGREAVAAAAALARAGGVRVRVIAVAEDEPLPESEVAAALAELLTGVDHEIAVSAEDPATALIAASKSVDLMVMGSRALGRKRAVMLGSVSRKVADHCACPLLVLPRGGGAKREALLAGAAAEAARTS